MLFSSLRSRQVSQLLRDWHSGCGRLAAATAIAAIAGCGAPQASLSPPTSIPPAPSAPTAPPTAQPTAKPRAQPTAKSLAQPPATSRNAKAIDLNNQGVSKLEKADYKAALTLFNQAIQADPKMAEAYLGSAIAQSGLNQRPAAIQNYTRAIALKRNFAEAFLNRADEYRTLGKQPQAIADLKQAAKLFTQRGDSANARLAAMQIDDLTAPVATQPDSPAAQPSPQPANTPPPANPETAKLALAKHLSQTGAKLYGTYWCPYCTRQKQLFGEAASLVPEVECDPNGANPQPAVCASANISSYPTWEIQGQLYRGMRSLDDLADLSGYRGARNFDG